MNYERVIINKGKSEFGKTLNLFLHNLLKTFVAPDFDFFVIKLAILPKPDKTPVFSSGFSLSDLFFV